MKINRRVSSRSNSIQFLHRLARCQNVVHSCIGSLTRCIYVQLWPSINCADQVSLCCDQLLRCIAPCIIRKLSCEPYYLRSRGRLGGGTSCLQRPWVRSVLFVNHHAKLMQPEDRTSCLLSNPESAMCSINAGWNTNCLRRKRSPYPQKLIFSFLFRLDIPFMSFDKPLMSWPDLHMSTQRPKFFELR